MKRYDLKSARINILISHPIIIIPYFIVPFQNKYAMHYAIRTFLTVHQFKKETIFFFD